MAAAGFKLYNYWRSSASWRVRVALAVKGVEYEYVVVNLLSGAHRAEPYTEMNPMAQVPTLVTPEGHMLTQSIAIIEYLEERFPEAPKLLPGDAVNRANIRNVVEVINSGIQPLQNLSVLQYIEANLGEAHKAPWAKHWIEKGLAALESLVQRFSTDHRYCVGTELSAADCCLIPQLYASRRFGADLSKYPTLLKIEQHLITLPAFVAADAANQPDAQK
jgi:maleylpyruvate isomerase